MDKNGFFATDMIALINKIAQDVKSQKFNHLCRNGSSFCNSVKKQKNRQIFVAIWHFHSNNWCK